MKESLSDFPLGDKNDAYAKYFIGQSYLAPLAMQPIPTFNVTFEPGCRNNWHIHHAQKGGGQLLICVAGQGFYQEEGKPVQRLKAGDVVVIAPNVKHWHGAQANSWFQHIAQEIRYFLPSKICTPGWIRSPPYASCRGSYSWSQGLKR